MKIIDFKKIKKIEELLERQYCKDLLEKRKRKRKRKECI